MKYLLILLLFTTTGCSSLPKLTSEPEIVERVVKVNKVIYPELPHVPYPPNIILVPFNWDWPRTEDLDIKNSKKCKSVLPLKHDKKFWKECGINKVDLTSNLYLGMNETNYRVFIQNWDRLLGREKQWRSIVDEVNRQRIEFRNKNKKE